jgi:hypothetical protein
MHWLPVCNPASSVLAFAVATSSSLFITLGTCQRCHDGPRELTNKKLAFPDYAPEFMHNLISSISLDHTEIILSKQG